MCLLPYRAVEHEDECELCGRVGDLVSVEGCDRCPTDRGTEERYYTMLICKRCDARHDRGH